MIDRLNEIFSLVAEQVRATHPDTTITGEFNRSESRFPVVTLDEIQNISVDRLEDSSGEEKFAGVTYRLQVSSNKISGKKQESRSIFATADAIMRSLGLHRVTYTTTPEIYESTVYSITATYEATIDRDGTVYRR